ncbi:M14 family metallopeptidase [Shewanella sp. 1_MG-2023]|uniref:succinylglutamate desuccinylase/aspartoacylase family protein n=1 Tax=unclassified Shewanella TaxID=196818 RepID=UPI000C830CC7|nr:MULTISPECIES: succinylglutamate desuccinylase/aspartoacylase family protein [unclassified Shewanella]MDO6611120.1 M14 family metallopeptidase [Shewanella sp. 7_MG-2023]MDO6771003.1 M14 family metallopeptidase [Shewanella sp. 2_MG-2023]MDO6794610.1 M14 family metallopeptidase [Shewanella sp. 1_MG-2023]PMG79339.1 succinylglutamate desuccinylase [Shewanella sp. 10N.286.51.B7]
MTASTGTSKALTSQVELGELATGQALTAPLFSFKGSDSAAPSVYIQANVHGAEVQGNAVIYQLMTLLESYTILGDIRCLPLANPLGINQKSGEFTLGRFDPITGVNWNREYYEHADIISNIPQWFELNQGLSDAELVVAFRELLTRSCQQRIANTWGISTGHRLAVSLQSMAHDADIVLDLHTGPKSAKHLYCPEYDVEAAGFFSIPFSLIIPNEFGGAMDEAAFYPWWQLQQYCATQQRHFDVPVAAFTLELASQERIDMADAKEDALGILAYLSHRGVIEEKVLPAEMPRWGCYLKDYKKFHAPKAGLVEYCAEVGKPLAAGESLVTLLRLDQYGSEQALTSVSLPCDCVPVLHFASASVHQGTELYKVMTNVFEIK